MTAGPEILYIEAPDKLPPYQNFYEQPPFQEVIANLASEGTFSIPELRRILTYVGRASKSTEDALQHTITETQGLAKAIRDVVLKQKFDDPTKKSEYYGIITDILNRLGKSLSDYPYWAEYIDTELQRALYDAEGNFITKNIKYLPFTYGKKTSDRLLLDGRLKLGGLDEMLPHMQGYNPNLNLIERTDKPVGNRRWAILKASNLISER